MKFVLALTALLGLAAHQSAAFSPFRPKTGQTMEYRPYFHPFSISPRGIQDKTASEDYTRQKIFETFGGENPFQRELPPLEPPTLGEPVRSAPKHQVHREPTPEEVAEEQAAWEQLLKEINSHRS